MLLMKKKRGQLSTELRLGSFLRAVRSRFCRRKHGARRPETLTSGPASEVFSATLLGATHETQRTFKDAVQSCCPKEQNPEK